MDPIDHSLPLLALYAETHFRFFRGFPSLLYRRTPEIVFDVPRRIDPGLPLPVMLLINDIDRFPIELGSVTIAINSPGKPPSSVVFEEPREQEISHPLRHQSRVFLFRIDRSRLPDRDIFVNAKTLYRQKGRKQQTVLNDNLPSSTKNPFRCHVAESTLPGRDFCSYGDLHVHTQFSQSHVEFGPPVEVIQAMAHAYGIDFLGITDHSYDLACHPENYLLEDAAVKRWDLLLEDIHAHERNEPILIPGEEISVRNHRGSIVHLCGVGMSEFIAGSADGARRNKVHTISHSIPEAIDKLHQQGALAYAAHPGASSSLLQGIFLKRGSWDDADVKAQLDGFQAVNSGFFGSWDRAKRLWVKMLLENRKVPLLGGNDAHGDFNRYRSIGMPFLQVSELPNRYFAGAVTGLYGKPMSSEQVMEKIRAGETFVTEGPFITISSSVEPLDSVIGHHVPPGTERLFAIFATTHESGMPVALCVFRGTIGGEESVVLSKNYADSAELFVAEEFALERIEGKGYLRAELLCRTTEGEVTHAVTSAAYLEK